MTQKQKNSFMKAIGRLGGQRKVKTKGFGADPSRASWAGKIGSLTKRLGRKPSKAEVEELKSNLGL